jgi:hypothetical protein
VLDLQASNLVTDSKEIVEQRSRIVGRTLLYKSSSTASRICDTYISWMLAGVGASYALILANVASIAPYISPLALKRGVIIFLVAAAFVAFEKLVAIYIAQTSIENSEVQAYARETSASGAEIDLTIVNDEMSKATLPHTRWLNRAMRRFLDEPRARTVAKAAQVQYVVAVIALATMITSLAFVALGLKV